MEAQALRLGRSRAQGTVQHPPAWRQQWPGQKELARALLARSSLAFPLRTMAAATRVGTQREQPLVGKSSGGSYLTAQAPATLQCLVELETHPDKQHPRSIWLILC